MPLGNDIIDLSAGRGHRPQYYERLRRLSCYDSELELVRFLPEIDGLWLLWSIKEAAFKSAVKRGWDIRFTGKDFPVSDLAPQQKGYLSHVTADGEVLSVKSEFEEPYVHSYVVLAGRHVTMHILPLQSTDYQEQSLQVRTAAIQQLAEQLKIPHKEISIAKDSQEVPHFHNNGQEMNVDLTLSHHGRFGAYLFAI